jgi:hypothetical protein
MDAKTGEYLDAITTWSRSADRAWALDKTSRLINSWTRATMRLQERVNSNAGNAA